MPCAPGISEQPNGGDSHENGHDHELNCDHRPFEPRQSFQLVDRSNLVELEARPGFELGYQGVQAPRVVTPPPGRGRTVVEDPPDLQVDLEVNVNCVARLAVEALGDG